MCLGLCRSPFFPQIFICLFFNTSLHPRSLTPLCGIVCVCLVLDHLCHVLCYVASTFAAVTYTFPRQVSIYGDSFTNVALSFNNTGTKTITDIKVGRTISPNITVSAFSAIASLDPGATQEHNIGIDFKDTINPAAFEFLASVDEAVSTFKVNLDPPVGELLVGIEMSEAQFVAKQGERIVLTHTQSP
jgi:hypothetical protein